MQITHSYWDDKNLGSKSYELVLENEDTISSLHSASNDLLNNLSANYVVVKVPVNLPRFLYELPQLGFYFLEAGIKLILKKRDYRSPNILRRLSQDASLSEVQPNELHRVLFEIQKGIFKTDRIAIDKNFGVKISNERYINWLNSLVNQGEKIFEVNIKNKPIGFFVVRPGPNNVYNGILTGLYKDFEKSGYGSVLMKKLNEYVWDSGAQTYVAHVSSNNINALRSNLVFGSMIDSMTYNYVKKLTP